MSHSLEAELDALLDQEYREVMQRDFLRFIRASWSSLNSDKLIESRYIAAIAEYMQALRIGKITRLIVNQPPRSAKALCLDTPIPTPEGMVTLRDVHPGDWVYGVDGNATQVIAETADMDGDCYEIEFSTGEQIIADSAHLWETTARVGSPGAGTGKNQKRGQNPLWSQCGYKTSKHLLRSPTRIRTTAEIAATVDLRDGTKRRSNHKVRVSSAVAGISVPVPIPPYVLGVWLGDGHSDGNGLSSENDEIPNLCRAQGVEVRKLSSKYGYGFGSGKKKAKDGFRARLRCLGVLNNKHIPEIYFLANEYDRWELLRGLMDTDGTISKKSGVATFCNMNPRLALDVKRLAASVGLKPSSRTRAAKLNGKTVGLAHYVEITAYKDKPIFRLQRKYQLQKTRRARGFQSHRTIVAVRKVGSRKVKCIQVNASDGMFLITDGYIPTHNSTIISIMFPCWVWLTEPQTKFIFYTYSFDKLSVPQSVQRRRLILSDWYRWVQGEGGYELSFDENMKWRFSNNRGGHMTVVTGATGTGGNFLIVDDPHSVEEALSDAERQAGVTKFREGLMSRLDNPQSDKAVLVMQRLHDSDVTGSLLRDGGWENLKLPAQAEHEALVQMPISGKVWRREEGDLLDKIRLSAPVLEQKKRELGARGYAGQYMQEPAPPTGNIFNPLWWRWYDPNHPPEFEENVISVDASFKGKESSDDVSVQAWGMVGIGSYLRARDTRKMGFAATKAAIRAMVARFNATIVLIEDKANGSAIIEELQQEFFVIAIDPGFGDKVARAEGCSPMVEAGTVHLPENEDGVRIQTLAAKFPNAEKDDIDALTQFLNWRRKRGASLNWFKKQAENAAEVRPDSINAEPQQIPHPSPKEVQQLAMEEAGMKTAKPQMTKQVKTEGLRKDVANCPDCASTNIFRSAKGCKCLDCGKIMPAAERTVNLG